MRKNITQTYEHNMGNNNIPLMQVDMAYLHRRVQAHGCAIWGRVGVISIEVRPKYFICYTEWIEDLIKT